MKAAVVVIIMIVVFAVGGYFGLPILIQKENRGLKSDVSDIQQRLNNLEEYIKKEEEAKKVDHLPKDADVQRIIKTVNTVLAKVTTLEDSYKKELSAVAERLQQQGASTGEALTKQSESMDKTNKETRTNLQRVVFNVAMATLRGNLIKVQMELNSKNVGIAKTEIDLIYEIFEKTKATTSDDQKKAIEQLQGALKKARDEIDSDLPAAINRVDLLWHEMGKLIRQ
jgi:vacuolar-type H+-ATPase subunit I/STV1